MGIDSIFDKKRNLRIHTVKNALSQEDLVAFLTEMYSSPEFDPAMNILWDLSGAKIWTASLSDVINVRDFVEKTLSQAKELRAALVVTVETDKVLAEMFGTLLEGSGISVKTFRVFEEALCWVTYKRNT